MRDKLLDYYERELRFIRRSASQFAVKYPAIAGSLLLEPEKCEDPHVERIIEAFAMLSARVHLRLDDEFPELADALLGIIYPHFSAPIPSMTIVQMHLDPSQSKVTKGITVDPQDPKSLFYSKPFEGFRCRFKPCYPVTLWPVEVSAVRVSSMEKRDPASLVDAEGIITIELKTTGHIPFSKLSIESLRFFLNGESSLMHRLFEIIFSETRGMLIRTGKGGKTTFLDTSKIRPVGFDRSEGLWEYPHESFSGFRLLHEYFTFPDKFLFVDLDGLGPALRQAATDRIEIDLLVSRWTTELVDKLEPQNFALGCTPAINLFPHQADPISLKQIASEYQVVPDVHSPYSFEVHSILDVSSSVPGKEEIKAFSPFYSLKHGNPKEEEFAFWHPVRRRSIRKDDSGTELFLALVDRNFKVTEPPVDVLQVKTMCTNRDLPARLRFDKVRSDFQLEAHPEISKILCLRKPTRTIRDHLEEDSRWKLISHLSLNFLSLSDSAGAGATGEDGGLALNAFREILRLYDFSDSEVTRKRIAGLVGIRSRRITRRLTSSGSNGFARGIEVSLEFDEEKYAGTNVFLFASILERFLGHYASINSFVQTIATIRQREGVLKRWPPRAGLIQLI